MKTCSFCNDGVGGGVLAGRLTLICNDPLAKLVLTGKNKGGGAVKVRLNVAKPGVKIRH